MFSSLNTRQRTGLILGPLLFVILLLLPVPEGMNAQAMRVAAVALLMATFWMSEALAIPVTALLPIILFPLLGVMPTARVTLAYGDQILFLFMGGFIIAIAMQKWNLHRRLALTVVRKVGSSPDRLVLGMMLATALLSMWVSNTATAMMMTPVGIAVIESTRRAGKGMVDGAMSAEGPMQGQTRNPDNFAIALMLSIAYAASIGGFSTLIGTPPNAIFIGQLNRLYGLQVGFLDWMLMAAPISACVLALCWFLLTRVFFRVSVHHVDTAAARTYLDEELAAMGPISTEERRVACVFLCVALAWMARGLLDQLTPESSLWFLFAPLLTAPAWDMVSDSAIAMCGALALFIVPASKGRGFLMDWDSAVKLPWDVILLMGGGFALAEAFTVTGLTEWLAGQFSILDGMPVFVLTLFIVIFIVFIGEMTSNAATATMFIPVMGALAVSMGMAPLTLMVPTVLATSLGFMLPVATPPNAIVFGSRYLRIEDMVKAGFWLNIGGALIVTLLSYALLDVVR